MTEEIRIDRLVEVFNACYSLTLTNKTLTAIIQRIGIKKFEGDSEWPHYGRPPNVISEKDVDRLEVYIKRHLPPEVQEGRRAIADLFILGLSPAEIAKRSGINPATISLIIISMKNTSRGFAISA